MATRSGWQRGQAGYLMTTLSELRRFYRMSCAGKLDHLAQATGTLRKAA